MIEAIVVGVIACVALAYVYAPLRGGPLPEVDDPKLALDDIEVRKRAALVAIVDLETERDVGKLTDDDLEVLRSQYMTEAATAMRELDHLSERDDIDEQLEAEIARVRATLRCPRCGALRTEAGCTGCGSS